MPYLLTYEVPKNSEGTRITYVREDEDGSMWIDSGLEEIRVNYCPFTGTPAKKQMKTNYVEMKNSEGDSYFYKNLTD